MDDQEWQEQASEFFAKNVSAEQEGSFSLTGDSSSSTEAPLDKNLRKKIYATQWTEDENKKIIAQMKEGVPYRKMQVPGRKQAAIITHIFQYKKHLEEASGVTLEQLKQKPLPKEGHWTNEEINMIIEQMKQGVPFAKIHVGNRTQFAVCTHINKNKKSLEVKSGVNLDQLKQPPPPLKDAWTNEEINMIIEQMKQGRPIRQMQVVGRTQPAVSTYISTHQKLLEEESGVTLEQLKQPSLPTSRKDVWTIEERSAIIDQINAGVQIKDIRVGKRSAAAIFLYISAHQKLLEEESGVKLDQLKKSGRSSKKLDPLAQEEAGAIPIQDAFKPNVTTVSNFPIKTNNSVALAQSSSKIGQSNPSKLNATNVSDIPIKTDKFLASIQKEAMYNSLSESSHSDWNQFFQDWGF